jgi:hypothetical protein
MESVLERLYRRGVSQRNADAYFDDTYHPDVAIHEDPTLPYGGLYVGLDGAARHALAFLATWDQYQRPEHHDVRHRVFLGNGEAMVAWQLRVADGPGTRTFPAVSHYRFASGLVVESRMFHFDSAALLEYLATAA